MNREHYESRLKKLAPESVVVDELVKEDRYTWRWLVKIDGRIIAAKYIPGWHAKSDINRARLLAWKYAYERIAKDGLKRRKAAT